MKKLFTKDNLKICFLIIYAVIIFLVLLKHEPSGDEVQAWNIARDLSIFDIFKQMRVEGHPCLWHLMLVPFAKLGLPVYFISVISYIVMIVTMYLIVYKSPFSNFIKIAIILSSPFLYFYSIISRSYCLIALIVTLICIFYNKRHDKPLIYGSLIFLLFNTHVIMGGMASILLFFFILESISLMVKNKGINKKLIISCIIGLFGGIVLCLQLFGSYETNILTTHLDYNSLGVSGLFDYFFEKYNLELYYFTNRIFRFNMSYIILVLLLILIIILSFYKCKEMIMFLVSYIYFMFINYFIFYSITLRAVIVIFLLMFICWIIKEDIKLLNNKVAKYCFNGLQILLIFYSILSIPFGVESYLDDFNNEVTDAHNVASYIEKNIEEDSMIIYIGLSDVSILGYLPNRSFYNLSTNEYMTFLAWDDNVFRKVDYMDIVDALSLSSTKAYILYYTDINSEYDNMIEKVKMNYNTKLVYESKNDSKYFNTSQQYIAYELYEISY